MKLFGYYSLRSFVFLLLSVFVINTTYAGGMMVSATLEDLPVTSIAQQPTGAGEAHEHDCHLQHADQKQQPHKGCGHCNHCLACSSILTQGHAADVSIINQMVLAISFEQIYLSPISHQPEKPPIV